MLIIKNNTKIILRISGLPKLNIFRYIFWKLFSKKIYKITCPTLGTYKYLIKKKIFDKDKLYVLRDPAILLDDYAKKKFNKVPNFTFKDNKIIVGIGRLTKQKNFSLLIRAFSKILKKYPEYILIKHVVHKDLSAAGVTVTFISQNTTLTLYNLHIVTQAQGPVIGLSKCFDTL